MWNGQQKRDYFFAGKYFAIQWGQIPRRREREERPHTQREGRILDREDIHSGGQWSKSRGLNLPLYITCATQPWLTDRLSLCLQASKYAKLKEKKNSPKFLSSVGVGDAGAEDAMSAFGDGEKNVAKILDDNIFITIYVGGVCP